MTQTKQMPALLTVAEFATALRVTRRTVYNWARNGEVASVTVSGTVRIPAWALEELMATTTTESEQA